MKRFPVILGVVVVLAFLGAGAYFFSDVFSTKVDQAVEQFAEWTPENIAKDPGGYLHFCKQQTEKTIQDLKASEIATNQNRAKILSMKEDSQRKIDVGKGALEELKVLYRSAEEDASWPAKWKDQPRDKDWTQRQIVGLHGQIEQEKALVGKCDQAIRRCDAELVKIKALMSQAQGQLGEIKLAERRIEVEQLSADLKDRLVGMKTVVGSLVDSVEGVSSDITLDGLAGDAEGAFNEKEFEEIMKSDE